MQDTDYSKSERTKRFIIETVAPIFNKKGYAATSMSDLTSVTGLSRGSIYGNFKNKDEVALCAFEYNAEFVNNNLKIHIERARTQKGKLLAYPETFRVIYESMLANGGCPILNTSVDSSEINTQLHEAVCKRINGWKRTLVFIVEEGVRNGEFSSNVKPDQTAEVLICLVEGGYAMAKATGQTSYLENSIAEMERIIHSM